MAVKVTEVIDGDTFKILEGWKWNGQSGNLVRPTGYDTPETGKPGYDQATEKLKRIVLGRYVELTKAVNIDRGRLVCDVFVDGKNLASFFPEYKV